MDSHSDNTNLWSDIQQRARENQKESAEITNESRLGSTDPKRKPSPPKTNTAEELAKLAERTHI